MAAAEPEKHGFKTVQQPSGIAPWKLLNLKTTAAKFVETLVSDARGNIYRSGAALAPALDDTDGGLAMAMPPPPGQAHVPSVPVAFLNSTINRRRIATAAARAAAAGKDDDD